MADLYVLMDLCLEEKMDLFYAKIRVAIKCFSKMAKKFLT